MLLNQPANPQIYLSRLGAALRTARKAGKRGNSDDFGKAIGVSGRTLRALEASGKGSTESLIRILLALSPEALEELIQKIESVEPMFASMDEALSAATPAGKPRDGA